MFREEKYDHIEIGEQLELEAMAEVDLEEIELAEWLESEVEWEES